MSYRTFIDSNLIMTLNAWQDIATSLHLTLWHVKELVKEDPLDPIPLGSVNWDSIGYQDNTLDWEMKLYLIMSMCLLDQGHQFPHVCLEMQSVPRPSTQVDG